MIACLISFVCFALTVPMQVIMTFLRTANKRLVAKDRKQTKAQKGDTDGGKKGGVTSEAQLKERFSVGKKSLKIKDPKMRAIAITLEALIISLKFLINVLRAVAMIVQVMGIVGLLMMFIVLIALLAAVGGCITAVMGDGWQGISGGSYTPTGGNQQLESSVGDGGGDNSSWMAAINTMGNWYCQNVTTYQSSTSGHGTGSRKGYQCTLSGYNKTVYDDCSAFMSACGDYMGWNWGTSQTSGWWRDTSNEVVKQHFRWHPEGEMGISYQLKGGDILAMSGHVEVVIGVSDNKIQTFGWGSIHTKIPSSTGYYYGGSYAHGGSCKKVMGVWEYLGD